VRYSTYATINHNNSEDRQAIRQMQCAVYVPASAVEKTNSNNYIDLATCTKQIKVNIKVCEIVDKQS